MKVKRKEKKRGDDDDMTVTGMKASCMDSREYGVRSEEYGVSSEEYGVRSEEYGVSSEEYGVSSEGYGVSSEEHGVSSEEHGVSSEEYGRVAFLTFALHVQCFESENESFFVYCYASMWRIEECQLKTCSVLR